jgi:DNA invertase Pin-like site-specific DNA recombinase
MPMYGYARVSSLSQSTEVQVSRLKAVGCDVVREEAA